MISEQNEENGSDWYAEAMAAMRSATAEQVAMAEAAIEVRRNFENTIGCFNAPRSFAWHASTYMRDSGLSREAATLLIRRIIGIVDEVTS